VSIIRRRIAINSPVIRRHHRAAAIDRLGVGNGMTLCLLSGRAALH